jgi:ATP-binding cassette, subfamily B (MDR/TAP), member 1
VPPGSAAGTITAAANTLQLGISEKLGVLIEFMTSIIAAMAVAFTYSWLLTLVTASTIFFISLVLSVLLPLVLKQQANQDKAETKANSVASEAFGTIRMITACGAEGRVAQRFEEWVNEAKRYGLITSPLYALQFGLIFFSLHATFALAFWFGTKSYYEGRVSGVSTVIV